MSLSREASALWHSADAVDKLSRLEIPKQLTELEKRKRAAEIITNRTIAQRNKAIACDPRIASMANPMVRRDPNAIAEGGTSRRKKGVRDCSVAGAGGFRADIATDSSGKRVTLKAAMSLDQLDMTVNRQTSGTVVLQSSAETAPTTCLTLEDVVCADTRSCTHKAFVSVPIVLILTLISPLMVPLSCLCCGVFAACCGNGDLDHAGAMRVKSACGENKACSCCAQWWRCAYDYAMCCSCFDRCEAEHALKEQAERDNAELDDMIERSACGRMG